MRGFSVALISAKTIGGPFLETYPQALQGHQSLTMSKMSLSDVQALLNVQQADSLAATNAAELSEERARALDYYLGNMDEDMPPQEGRSRAVSTDVSDAIEGACFRS
jgi:hypothetical protein